MKTVLITGFNQPFAPLAAITIPRMALYANRHGLDFWLSGDVMNDVPNGIYWFSLIGLVEMFRAGYERVIALDVDQFITNYDFEFNVKPEGLHASRDWGADATGEYDFSMCGTVWHEDVESMAFRALELEEAWRDKDFPAQAPLRHVCQQAEFADRTTVHPRRKFNAVPDEVLPGSVVEPWQPGDFAAHLTMIPVAERIALAQKFL